MKTIGFLSNKLTLRGTEVNLFDYADFNETILGNKSIIITRPYEYVMNVSPRDVTPLAYNKFKSRFPVEYYINPSEIEEIVKQNNIDVLFIEKAGSPNDGLVFNCCKTIIHAVFTTNEPHGDLYAPISEALNTICRTNYPVLPYMVRVFDTNENLRDELGIPKDAIVFGSYSGADEYTNEDVKRAVSNIVLNPEYSNIYFIYLNIDKFGPESPRLKFLPGTADMKYKRMFINTCDAMLYARNGGETFGLACGEFSICNKPVIACPGQHSNAHEVILGDDMIKFHNYDDVYDIITSWPKHNKDVSNNGYKAYTPEKVMLNFEKHLALLFNPTLELLSNIYNEKYLAFIDDQIGYHIKNSNRFSPSEIIFLEQYIKDNDNIIEGGANIGSHTIPLSKLNKNGKTYCFEPQYDIFDILKTNIKLNNISHIIPYRYALGDEYKIINYNKSDCRYDFNRGGFSIPTDNKSNYDSQLIIKPITDFYEIMSLDSIKLSKLDIEGYEPIVLKTMKDLIIKHNPILFIEYNDSTFNDIVSFIKSLDYTVFYFNTLCSQYNQCIGKEDSSIKLCDINIVCFPNSKIYNIPPYLVRVNNEILPNKEVFVVYTDIIQYTC
jgi:FkbM family methyltransferase